MSTPTGTDKVRLSRIGIPLRPASARPASPDRWQPIQSLDGLPLAEHCRSHGKRIALGPPRTIRKLPTCSHASPLSDYSRRHPQARRGRFAQGGVGGERPARIPEPAPTLRQQRLNYEPTTRPTRSTARSDVADRLHQQKRAGLRDRLVGPVVVHPGLRHRRDHRSAVAGPLRHSVIARWTAGRRRSSSARSCISRRDRRSAMSGWCRAGLR